MADSTALVKVALVGVAGYVAYEMGWLSVIGLTPGTVTAAQPAGTPAPTSSGTTPVSSTITAPPAPSKPLPSLATIQAQVLALSGAPAAGYGVDQWNYFLNQALAPYGLSAPDPSGPFSAAWANYVANQQLVAQYSPGWTVPSATWDRSHLYSFADYWAVMGPVLASQSGLSGFYGRGW